MISRTSEDERLRRAFAAGSQRPSPEGGCPEPDRLWAAASGELPVAERRAIVDHTARCAACAEDFRLAAHVAGGVPRVRPAAVVREFPKRRWLTGVLAAAAVMAVMMVGLQGWVVRTTGPDVYRSGEERAIASLLGSEPRLPRDAVVLRWEGPKGARYDVFVQTTRLEEVSQARDLVASEFHVPAEDLASLPAGTRLFWRVEAILSDGSRLPSKAFDLWIEE